MEQCICFITFLENAMSKETTWGLSSYVSAEAVPAGSADAVEASVLTAA